MKKYILTISFLLLGILQINAQEKKESREKIKALKVSYLTAELQLSSSEAQKFWPIYNVHEEKMDNLRNKWRVDIKNKIKDAGNLEGLSEAEAKKLVLMNEDLGKKMILEKEDFLKKVSKFLPYKKILKLHISEKEFARKLMRRYGKRNKK
ncbi:sensor of ECF-type sigma factor [Polaribacter aestuariivivens]|uniref:Sensor of ECF-type sigma factor n=1 Tax=Polaribacter aestuariivivens TaxID=2304626 RepID=A0A5S3N0N7_9FLAO|nr:sensor of ECF-type sigma factor [Polaribacter aestuariivivens]TMM28848.1 sensor of ECF-type sigma factor [Polaribacter aestuariivivens]